MSRSAPSGWRDRYEAEGADGLYDRRLAASRRGARRWTMARVLELFDRRYWETAKHFHEKLVADHGFKRSYNWLRLSLQAHGRTRGAQAWGAPAQAAAPCPARHDVAPGRLEPRVGPRSWDLIVTMDDATSDIYSAFFVAEEGTMSSFQGVSEAIRAKGLFCSLYADRASHYWNTPEAGGKVDKDTPTQVGRALAQLGIELIPAYSPEARGRSERMFGTLQKRLPQELRLAGITDMVEANRFLKEGCRFGRGPGHRLRPLHRRARRHPVHPRGTHRLKRQHCATSAWHFRSPPAATADVKARVVVPRKPLPQLPDFGARRWSTNRNLWSCSLPPLPRPTGHGQTALRDRVSPRASSPTSRSGCSYGTYNRSFSECSRQLFAPQLRAPTVRCSVNKFLQAFIIISYLIVPPQLRATWRRWRCARTKSPQRRVHLTRQPQRICNPTHPG